MVVPTEYRTAPAGGIVLDQVKLVEREHQYQETADGKIRELEREVHRIDEAIRSCTVLSADLKEIAISATGTVSLATKFAISLVRGLFGILRARMRPVRRLRCPRRGRHPEAASPCECTSPDPVSYRSTGRSCPRRSGRRLRG